MSGFKDDVIAILKTNLMLHGDSVGLLYGISLSSGVTELADELDKRKLLYVVKDNKIVIRYSYVVIPNYYFTSQTLLSGLEKLSENGILIGEVTGKNIEYKNNYVSLFGKFTATKVMYEDRAYIVIHSGVDYGN